MDGKLIVFLVVLIQYANSAGLLRTPKVYNAVITTDENLKSSRAFPVIQPTIHETGIATYPFSPFTPYRFYNPSIVQLGQPFPHRIYSKMDQVPISQGYLHNNPPPPPDVPPKFLPEEIKLRENDSKPQPPPKQVPITVVPDEKSPIPLSEFGLPPSLVPLHPYPHHLQVNLQPYPSNHYPLIYETSNQYPEHFLPPYEEYPAHSFGIRAPPPFIQKQQHQQQQHHSAVNSKPSIDPKDKYEPADSNSNFDGIKNGITNKNSEVPDVPPPPLPSSAKSS